MKRRSNDIHRPSAEEFRASVESLFSFLCTEYGYAAHWDDKNRFSVEYVKASLVIKVYGLGWGSSGHVTLMLDEEELPYSKVTTPINKKLTQSVGKPQLDDLSEYAYRLRYECKDILGGDLSRLTKWRTWAAEQRQRYEDFRKRDKMERFFAKAEDMWRLRDFVSLVAYLRPQESRLNVFWRRRYGYAQKHA
jgi:hypothetical protein